VLDRLTRGLDERARYFVALSVFHEDMHDEAFTYTRQTHGWPAPRLSLPRAEPAPAGPLPGDASVPGATLLLGARAGDHPFVFDNEKWAHPVEVAPFAIARAPVTQSELTAFVEDGGYRRRELWSPAGWRWREGARAEHPLHWQKQDRGWLRRDFAQWRPLEPHRPALHVCWWEAEAYCAWAKRRLPSEAEWELAAGGPEKRPYPWGDAPLDETRANLDWRAGGCLDVAALPAGDSPYGCRQMMGNVWEWTATEFGPYPGFVRDPYQEYSEPWFTGHKVLRGGAWITRGRLLRNTWRNFYTPDRRDVWCGFRTCAV
jgi:iron(II)-dependent oxidoreductase